jgi:hypothetical protein
MPATEKCQHTEQSFDNGPMVNGNHGPYWTEFKYSAGALPLASIIPLPFEIKA